MILAAAAAVSFVGLDRCLMTVVLCAAVGSVLLMKARRKALVGRETAARLIHKIFEMKINERYFGSLGAAYISNAFDFRRRGTL
jgi:hypothetical protein